MSNGAAGVRTEDVVESAPPWWAEPVATYLDRVMDLSKRVSLWTVEDVLEWVQEQCPAAHVNTLQKAIIKHSISGRALLRLKEHHLELLGVEAEEQQQEILQDLLLLRVQEEISELTDICSDCFSS